MIQYPELCDCTSCFNDHTVVGVIAQWLVTAANTLDLETIAAGVAR